MANAISVGFTSLTRFSGRDTRIQFWPYCASVLGLAMVANMAVFVWILTPLLAKTEVAPIPDFNLAIGGVALWAGAVVVLLASAVTRRLHDIGRSGYWGLMPLPFLFGGFFLMSRFFSKFLNSPAPDLSIFFMLFANNFVYLALLGLLIYFLRQKSDAMENRFGRSPSAVL